MAENIQPRFQANIHKENFSLDQLSKSTRQAIRTARNKGLEVKFGGLDLLDWIFIFNEENRVSQEYQFTRQRLLSEVTGYLSWSLLYHTELFRST